MAKDGWLRLLEDLPPVADGSFRIEAYSEFMPPPRIGWKPYGGCEPSPFEEEDPYGWQFTEYEEVFEVQPGLEELAGTLMKAMRRLGEGRPARTVGKVMLADNPYWPAELEERAGRLAHERYVVLLPLALSKTQDDKGRVRWTLFGSSDQGPERGFWKSSYLAPGRERPAEEALVFFRSLLSRVYGVPAGDLGDLRSAGFRILPMGDRPAGLPWTETALPSWAAPLLMSDGDPVGDVRFLLTFRPFPVLPPAVRQAYVEGRLHLIPFPGSLIFWGTRPYLRLAPSLPGAMQIPLLHVFERHEAPRGLRVLQSGWLHERRPDQPEPDPGQGVIRNTYRRTNRWGRLHLHEDELEVAGTEDQTAHVLFSSAPDDVGLYGKPMARNAQIWTRNYELLLDGPRASRAELAQAAAALRAGGQFGYRFLFPAMRVGRHEVFWHRPLAAFLSPATGQAEVLPVALPGYLTAHPVDPPGAEPSVELWPRRPDRLAYRSVIEGFSEVHGHPAHQAALNIRKLMDAWRLMERRPLPRSFARHLLTVPKSLTLEDWLGSLAKLGADPEVWRFVARELEDRLEPPPKASRRGGPKLPEPITFSRTARRSFEVAYWKTIAELAQGRFVTKENADSVEDPATLAMRPHHRRDLDALGDYLLECHRRAIDRAGMTGRALVGRRALPLADRFRLPLVGRLARNQEGTAEEREPDHGHPRPGPEPRRDHGRPLRHRLHGGLLREGPGRHGRPPGRRRRRRQPLGHRGAPAGGARSSWSSAGPAGSSATSGWSISPARSSRRTAWGRATWPKRSSSGRCGCGCPTRRPVDLSAARVEGVYVLDMIAHNSDPGPGRVPDSPPAPAGSPCELAYQAHLANMIWNARVPVWNRRPSRRGLGRGQRSPDPRTVPAIAAHLPLLRRDPAEAGIPRSALYNTDGQIFSDAGIPVVLFMENYDISRKGYHDTHDTMENIDLDFGAALAAIAIESAARVAVGSPERLIP